MVSPKCFAYALVDGCFDNGYVDVDVQAEGRLKVICFVVDKANILSRKRNRDNAAAAKSLKGRSL